MRIGLLIYSVEYNVKVDVMRILSEKNYYEKKLLGVKQLQPSNLGLGCMGMSECYGKTNDLESIKTIHRAFGLKITQKHLQVDDLFQKLNKKYLIS
jgi:hypothetical protein